MTLSARLSAFFVFLFAALIAVITAECPSSECYQRRREAWQACRAPMAIFEECALNYCALEDRRVGFKCDARSAEVVRPPCVDEWRSKAHIATKDCSIRGELRDDCEVISEEIVNEAGNTVSQYKCTQGSGDGDGSSGDWPPPAECGGTPDETFDLVTPSAASWTFQHGSVCFKWCYPNTYATHDMYLEVIENCGNTNGVTILHDPDGGLTFGPGTEGCVYTNIKVDSGCGPAVGSCEVTVRASVFDVTQHMRSLEIPVGSLCS